MESMLHMSMRGVGMVRRFLVFAGLMVICRFVMMSCCMFMMLGRFPVMHCCFRRHGCLLRRWLDVPEQ